MPFPAHHPLLEQDLRRGAWRVTGVLWLFETVGGRWFM